MGTGTATDERRLHARLLAGDVPALAELYNQFGVTVFGVALRVTADRDAADDVTQSIFIDMWRQPERFNPDRGNLRPWLATLAHHRAVDWLRRDQAARRRDNDAQAQLEAPPDIEEAVVALLTADRVREALDQLPENERTPIRLAYFSGRTYREVAADLGVPEGTVKSRIRSGMCHLARALQSELLAPAGP